VYGGAARAGTGQSAAIARSGIEAASRVVVTRGASGVGLLIDRD